MFERANRMSKRAWLAIDWTHTLRYCLGIEWARSLRPTKVKTDATIKRSGEIGSCWKVKSDFWSSISISGVYFDISLESSNQQQGRQFIFVLAPAHCSDLEVLYLVHLISRLFIRMRTKVMIPSAERKYVSIPIHRSQKLESIPQGPHLHTSSRHQPLFS